MPDIDTSDIPEADEAWFKRAKLVKPGQRGGMADATVSKTEGLDAHESSTLSAGTKIEYRIETDGLPDSWRVKNTYEAAEALWKYRCDNMPHMTHRIVKCVTTYEAVVTHHALADDEQVAK